MRVFNCITVLFLCVFAVLSAAMAQPKTQDQVETICDTGDDACMVMLWEKSAGEIENANWKDQSYRELSKILADKGRYDDAFRIWELIANPDTKALTIRGIGMAAAHNGLNSDQYSDQYDVLFRGLREKAETITHPPSYAIALTYIAMAQAFAGDDQGAWDTAAAMQNDALRHKAYGETAEIQAEMGKLNAALHSIEYIESEAYRNKSYAIVSKILTDQGAYDDALLAAMPLSNAYKKAKAIEYIMRKKMSNTAQDPISKVMTP